MDYDTLDRLLRPGAPGEAPRAGVADALEDIACGKRELRAVRHPLGFLCLPLVRDGVRGVCVHLFGTGIHADPTAAPMHAHSWELRSYVLYGRVGNLPVAVTEEARSPTHRIFEVFSAPSGVDELRPTSRLVHCEPGPAVSSGSGETYSLPAGEFHATVVARGQPAATLVLGRSLPGYTDLSLGPLHGRGHRTVRRRCGAEHTERTVRTALRRIHAEQRD
ncbi:hypothetical protein [Streptomyces sp. GS7]|uniref:hypothetical protein n=1 Tax=Streptomyces sp. GS7 TaxID=2692234 RepID=UPI001316D446|nr:hypothetical protein [Streptomyces sp. GS7]QHC22993.1 hypothetical protein GR130_17790 [Streptomyces sp. GS7]